MNFAKIAISLGSGSSIVTFSFFHGGSDGHVSKRLLANSSYTTALRRFAFFLSISPAGFFFESLLVLW